MNFYKLFYWLSVSDGVKHFFDISSDMFTWFTVLAFIVLAIATLGVSNSISANNNTTEEEDKVDPDTRSWKLFRSYTATFFYTCLIFSMLTWIGYIIVPSKKDALIIIAGGAVGNFITSDSSSKAIPAELMLLLRSKIKSEILDLNINSVKDTLESKSKEELINLLKEKKN